jgi:membrane protease subunit (stomatin/prohibitin family)
MRAAVVGGTAYAVGKRAQRNQDAQAELDAYHQQEYAEQYAAQQAPAAPSRDDQFEQLAKLKQLLDQGVLTQAEFDAQKAKILAGV